MKRVIIVEGPDNIGKTTLIGKISEVLHEMKAPNEIRHWGPPKKEGAAALQEQLKVLEKELKGLKSASEKLELWDRSIIGESVYGPMFRKYDHGKYLDQLLTLKTFEKQILFIVMYADQSTYINFNIKPKKDEKVEYQKQSTAQSIAVKFVNLAARLNLKNTIYINCNNYLSLEQRNEYIVRRVKLWLKKKRFEHNHTGDYTHSFFNETQMLWGTGKGFLDRERYDCSEFEQQLCSIGNDHVRESEFGKMHERPTGACGADELIKYIFIGEAPGKNGCGNLGIPFYDDVSGNLFQTALDALGIHPVHYYMTNIIKCCPFDNDLAAYGNMKYQLSRECVKNIITELDAIRDFNPRAKVFAVGKVPTKLLGALKYDNIASLYHPAYYCRIGQSDRFILDLKAAIGE